MVSYKRQVKCFLLGFLISSLFWLYFLRNSNKTDSDDKSISSKRNSWIVPKQGYVEGFNDHLIGLIKSENEIKMQEYGYSKHAFNTLISERIGFRRKIPNTADASCTQSYPSLRRTASILICFHNEAWSTLLRTVYSILDRTPDKLLKEIILMDDYSSDSRLVSKLPSFLESNLPKVKLYHTERREGLIRARIKAASIATGDTIVFLDSHCEVNINWLEPLMLRIEENQRNVVCPVIDTINPDTFMYRASPLVRGGFNWGLHFSWEPLPVSVVSLHPSKPYRSPTMAGGLFAMDRNYFINLGTYDKGMEIWGSENLEISFRIWMCGGSLEIVPCSRVGHVFRDRRPYDDGGKSNAENVNTVRLANVWLDEYKTYVFNVRQDLKKIKTNVTHRLRLREKLKCKSFHWYLQEIYPEMGIPNIREPIPLQRVMIAPPEIKYNGQLRHVATKLCLDTIGDPLLKKSLIVLRCCKETSSDSWSLNSKGEIMVNDKLCLAVLLYQASAKNLRTMKCNDDRSGQQWMFNKATNQMYNPASGLCLTSSTGDRAIMEICDNNELFQKWSFG